MGFKTIFSIEEQIIDSDDYCLHIFDPIIRRNVYIIKPNQSKDAFDNLMKGLGLEQVFVHNEDIAGASSYWTIHKETKQQVYFIVFRCDKPSIGCIAHECFHIVEFIHEHLGIFFHTKEANETFAYLLQFYVDAVTNYVYPKIKYK